MARGNRRYGFSAVLGSGRIAAQGASLFDSSDTPAARRIAARLVSQLRAGELDESIVLLRSHWSAHPGPAQARVQHELCLALMRQSLERAFHPQALWTSADAQPLLDNNGGQLSANDLAAGARELETLLVSDSSLQLTAASKTISDRAVFAALARRAKALGPAMVSLMRPDWERSRKQLYALPHAKISDALSEADWKKIFATGSQQQGQSRYTALRQTTRRFEDLAIKRVRASHSAELNRHKTKAEAELSSHPAIQATDLLLKRLNDKGMSRDRLKTASGLSKANVDKMLRRSTRPSNTYNSGKIPGIDAAKSLCSVLGVDWAVFYLANLPVEIGDSQRRRNDGSLHTRRQRQIDHCLDHLRGLNCPTDITDAIARDKQRLPRGDWHEPYLRLVAWERQRLGLPL